MPSHPQTWGLRSITCPRSIESPLSDRRPALKSCSGLGYAFAITILSREAYLSASNEGEDEDGEHPSMADLYRRKVERLETELTNPTVQLEASGIFRSTIASIKLTPESDAPEGMRVEVEGDLAAILAVASGKAKALKQMDPVTRAGSTAFQGVAGLGFEPRTFRL